MVRDQSHRPYIYQRHGPRIAIVLISATWSKTSNRPYTNVSATLSETTAIVL